MNPAVETIEEIEGFLQVFSDPYNEHGQGQPWPEPQLGMAATASAEGSQQGSSQSQVMLASMPTGMISASCSVPGRVLTQSSAGAPEEDLDAILQDLVEIFERNQRVTSCEQVNLTAAYQKTQAMGTTDCQRANVTANKMTGCDAGSQVQDTSGQKTLKDIQMTTLCGSQVNPHKDHQTLSGGQVTASGLHQIVYWGPMATSLGDQSQSLYLKQMTNTSNDQSLNGGQKMTRSNEQIISGGYQLSAVPRPELPAWTVSPVILEQLPPKHCNLQTKCSAFLKKADRWKSYVCPHQDCGKSYTRSSYLRVHQRTHSGEKPYACNEQGCEWRFSRSDELKRHMKRHTGERPYKCEACSKSFARSDHLTQHQRVHRAFRLGLEPSRL